MHIDWNSFTPGASLGGGLLIGLAAALLVLGLGRIAGIAGILGRALQSVRYRRPGRFDGASWAFIAGLLLAPALWRLFVPLPLAQVDAGTSAVVLAGLLVGFGVRLGNGCTSGHGVCGLSRGSVRSLANVAAFMGAGVATVFVLRQVLA